MRCCKGLVSLLFQAVCCPATAVSKIAFEERGTPLASTASHPVKSKCVPKQCSTWWKHSLLLYSPRSCGHIFYSPKHHRSGNLGFESKRNNNEFVPICVPAPTLRLMLRTL